MHDSNPVPCMAGLATRAAACATACTVRMHARPHASCPHGAGSLPRALSVPRPCHVELLAHTAHVHNSTPQRYALATVGHV